MAALHTTEILEAYENLALVTGRMRDAATGDDWDQVIELESECSALYSRIMSATETGPVDREYQRRKSELICQLLEDDAQIRERLSGQLTRLWRMIDGKGRVQQLGAAYGSGRA
jgi:flagellar protein FliT